MEDTHSTKISQSGKIKFYNTITRFPRIILIVFIFCIIIIAGCFIWKYLQNNHISCLYPDFDTNNNYPKSKTSQACFPPSKAFSCWIHGGRFETKFQCGSSCEIGELFCPNVCARHINFNCVTTDGIEPMGYIN